MRIRDAWTSRSRRRSETRHADVHPRQPLLALRRVPTPSAQVVAMREAVRRAYKMPAHPHTLARRRALALLCRRSPLEAARQASLPKPHPLHLRLPTAWYARTEPLVSLVALDELALRWSARRSGRRHHLAAPSELARATSTPTLATKRTTVIP
jgi:hypothetical protein